MPACAFSQGLRRAARPVPLPGVPRKPRREHPQYHGAHHRRASTHHERSPQWYQGASSPRTPITGTCFRKTLYPEIVQVVKLFGWEAAMASRVAEVRGREIAQIRAGACVRVANTVVAAVTPVLVTLATFITYTLGAGGVLTATQVRLRCGWNTCVRPFSHVA